MSYLLLFNGNNGQCYFIHNCRPCSSHASQMQNSWSVVDLLLQNTQWWHPIISSTYGFNLHRHMLDKILHVVHNSKVLRLITAISLLPCLYMGSVVDSNCRWGNFSLVLTDYNNISPPAQINSTRILKKFLGNLYLSHFPIAITDSRN